MPVFDIFDGITISVFSNDHLPPHCHVHYAEWEVLIDIRKITVYAGSLPRTQLRKAIAHVQIAENQEELLDAFYQLNPRIKRL